MADVECIIIDTNRVELLRGKYPGTKKTAEVLYELRRQGKTPGLGWRLAMKTQKPGSRRIYSILQEAGTLNHLKKPAGGPFVSLVLIPPTSRVNVRLPNGQVTDLSFSSSQSIDEMVERVAQQEKLASPLPYALYPAKDEYAIDTGISLAEYDPFLKDIWFMPRFWDRRLSYGDADMSMMYYQAVECVLSQPDEYRRNAEFFLLMAAMKTIDGFNEPSGKKKEELAAWKERQKKRKKIISDSGRAGKKVYEENVKKTGKVEGKDGTIWLMRIFLNGCFQTNPEFGATVFSVSSTEITKEARMRALAAPPVKEKNKKQKQTDVWDLYTEKWVVTLEQCSLISGETPAKVLRSIETKTIRKVRQGMEMDLFVDQDEGQVFRLFSEAPEAIVRHMVCLSKLVAIPDKSNKLKKSEKSEKQSTAGPAEYTTVANSSIFLELGDIDPELVGATDICFGIEEETEQLKKLDDDTVTSMFDLALVNDEMFESIHQQFVNSCGEIRDIVESVPGCLEGRIACVLTCLSYMVLKTLPPLDAFMRLRSLRAAALKRAQKLWDDFDFCKVGRLCSPVVADIFSATVDVIRPMTHWVSTVLLETAVGLDNTCARLLSVNDAISLSEFLGYVAIARACGVVGRDDPLLHVVLDIPVLPFEDPSITVYLSEVLATIIGQRQGKGEYGGITDVLLGQPHEGDFKVSELVDAVGELRQYAHFTMSPFAVFMRSNSRRFMTERTVHPISMVEMVDIVRTVGHMSLLSWRIDAGANNAMDISPVKEARCLTASLHNYMLQNSIDEHEVKKLSAYIFLELGKLISYISARESSPSVYMDVHIPCHALMKMLLGSDGLSNNAALLVLHAIGTEERYNLAAKPELCKQPLSTWMMALAALPSSEYDPVFEIAELVKLSCVK